jgi:hypothetical protein
MNDMQIDDDDFDSKIPTFEVAKQRRTELIAELREGGPGEQRLAELLTRCWKGNRCNLDECPVCQRRKQLPKWRIPASVSKSFIGTLAPQEIRLGAIKVVGERRPLNEEKLRKIAASIDHIGLQTPITVRMQKKKVILVSGWYRLAATERLGWDAIPCVEFCGDQVEARMWQIEENACRADLTVLERAEHIEEFRTLIQNKSEGGKLHPLAVISRRMPESRKPPRRLASRERKFAGQGLSRDCRRRRRLRCEN